MTRYVPSRHYLNAGVAALGFAIFSAWCGWTWSSPAYLAAALFVVSGGFLIYLAIRPAIEIHENHVAIGRRVIRWAEIRRLDKTGWLSPLIVHITLYDNRRLLLVYPGDLDSANSLLRHLRRGAREALIDGIPYRQFWGDGPAAAPPERTAPPPVRLLRPEDEAEVERLYQRLKAVRHLDPDNSTDEK